ncbi:hypothetical protein F5B19DRAFT_71724 [Rostrohypoxylon terebratum]|nr:hypothetical protein F5B19DRAFT_71724 [Rostrohypoxylon terebratum]
MCHTPTCVHSPTTGPSWNCQLDFNYSYELVEDQGGVIDINDFIFPEYSLKTERPRPLSSLYQYDVAVDRSPVPSERSSLDTVRSGTAAYNHDSNLSPLPSSSPRVTREDRENSTQNEYQTPRSTGSAAPLSPGLVRREKATKRHYLSSEVWEHHKEEIHELYIEQNKSLVELMELMEKKGIEATPRMYKAKFAQWGFVKNNKQKDVAMMLRLQRERGAVGKTTTFRRHGRSVDIETYMKRKGISSSDLAMPVANADLPDYLRALTPPPGEPHHMSLPSHLHAQNVLLSCFKDLTLSWNESAVAPQSFEHDFHLYFDGELCEATRDFGRACWFFKKSHNSHGALLSQRAFSSLHLIIKTPSALGLFDLLVASVISPDHGLIKELWKYLAGYAEVTLGSASTLYKLFAALDEIFRKDSLEIAVDFIFNCMESIIGMLLDTKDFARTVAPSISFFLLGDLILFSSSRTDLPNLQRVVACSSTPSQVKQACPSIIRLIGSAGYLWQHGPYDEHSAQLAWSSLQLVDEKSNQVDWKYWVSWRVIAHFHRNRCGPDDSVAGHHPRHALARYALQRAIDAAEAGRGFNEIQIFENMQTLEAWHREAGDTAQALAVQQRKEKGLNDYFQSLQQGRKTNTPRK